MAMKLKCCRGMDALNKTQITTEETMSYFASLSKYEYSKSALLTEPLALVGDGYFAGK